MVSTEPVPELKALIQQCSSSNLAEVVPDFDPWVAEWLAQIAKREPDAPCHAMRVAGFAEQVALRVGKPASVQHTLFSAALLHDVGKLRVPIALLNKPGPLTRAEYAVVQTHAANGGAMLERSPGLESLAPIVRAHHEHWNGAGYPDGLRGEAIPWEARVISVCDTVDAMSSDRPYRAALPLPAVIDEIRRCAGTQFDPCLAETVVEILMTTGQFVN